MQAIQESLQKYKIATTDKRPPRSNRETIINDIITKIKLDRKGTEWEKKKVEYMSIFMTTKHLSDDDLYFFYRMCEKSDNFSRLFYGLLRKK